MSLARPPYQRHGVSREEEKLWIGFYQRIHRDPVLASELLALQQHYMSQASRSYQLALGQICTAEGTLVSASAAATLRRISSRSAILSR